MLVAPAPARKITLDKGPNIHALPVLAPIPETIDAPVLLAVGDDISTDEILPAGARVLPYRSNIEALAEFAFEPLATGGSYASRARDAKHHVIVAGKNYGQGSSREHAALVPRYLGLEAVLAIRFARIHRENLINFAGAARLVDPDDRARIAAGDRVVIADVHRALRDGTPLVASVRDLAIPLRHDLTPRQIDIVLAGGLIALMRARLAHAA